jgi:hypothetical protein
MPAEDLVCYSFVFLVPLNNRLLTIPRSAILTKYENLLSFQKLSPKPTVLDYDVASLYTNDLLDAMMAYKNIWKKIHLG